MMRIKSGIFFALTTTASLIVACSWGGSGNGDPHPDSNSSHAVCGDGTCSASEVNSCPADCGSNGSNQNAVCGNGSCETTKGETAQSCPSDCAQGSGSGSGSSGNLNCNDPNIQISCLLCTQVMICQGVDAVSCAACGGGSGSGFGNLLCEGGAPDGVCNAAAGEDHTTCPADCP